MKRGTQVIGPVRIDELLGLLRDAVRLSPAEKFRPYRYRDPCRVDGVRLAELWAIDTAECAGCKAAWPCEDHQPPGYPFIGLAG